MSQTLLLGKVLYCVHGESLMIFRSLGGCFLLLQACLSCQFFPLVGFYLVPGFLLTSVLSLFQGFAHVAPPVCLI